MAVTRVTYEQLDYPGDGLHYLGGEPFTGVVEHRLPNGALEAEQEYKQGLLSGRKRVWYPSGVLQLEAECAWGGYHGRVRERYENGEVAGDAVYEYGIRIHATRWDEQGRVVEEFQLSEADPASHLLEQFRAAFKGGG